MQFRAGEVDAASDYVLSRNQALWPSYTDVFLKILREKQSGMRIGEGQRHADELKLTISIMAQIGETNNFYILLPI